jgi:hypothetical protein
MVLRVVELSMGVWMLAMSLLSPPAASARPVTFADIFFFNDPAV